MVAARPSALLAALILSTVAFTGCGVHDSAPASPSGPWAAPERPAPAFRVTQVDTTADPPAPEDTGTAPQEPEPEPTADPTDITPEPESPQPTQSASEVPSQTPTPSSASPTDASSPPATESAPATAAPDESAPSSLPTWLGLGALVAAGGALAWRLAAAARRRGWDRRLDVERAQGQWVVTELVPALTNPATPPQHLAQHWADAQPTLEQLADGLDALVVEAPDESRASTAQRLAAAVTQVRSSAAAHVALVDSWAPDPRAVEATTSALLTARTQLEAALGATGA